MGVCGASGLALLPLALQGHTQKAGRDLPVVEDSGMGTAHSYLPGPSPTCSPCGHRSSSGSWRKLQRDWCLQRLSWGWHKGTVGVTPEMRQAEQGAGPQICSSWGVWRSLWQGQGSHPSRRSCGQSIAKGMLGDVPSSPVP